MKRFFLGSILLGFGTLSIVAQSGTKSPYSQYGLGILSDQSQGFNRGMSGLFQGFRSGNQVNMQNPASYSAVDSLSMIFDVGVSGQITNFKEGGARLMLKQLILSMLRHCSVSFRNSVPVLVWYLILM